MSRNAIISYFGAKYLWTIFCQQLPKPSYSGYQLDFISFPFAPFDSLKISFWERLGILFMFSNRSSKITKSFLYIKKCWSSAIMSHITKSLQTPNKRFTSSELLKHQPLDCRLQAANPRQIGEIFDLQRLDNPSSRMSNLRQSGHAANFKFPYSQTQQTSYHEVQTCKLAIATHRKTQR